MKAANLSPLASSSESALKLWLLSVLLLAYVSWLVSQLSFAGVAALSTLVAAVRAARGVASRVGGWPRRPVAQVQLATIAVILFVLFVDGAINSEAWNSVCCSWCRVRSAAAAMSLV